MLLQHHQWHGRQWGGGGGQGRHVPPHNFSRGWHNIKCPLPRFWGCTMIIHWNEDSFFHVSSPALCGPFYCVKKKNTCLLVIEVMYEDTPTPCLENWPKFFKKDKKYVRVPPPPPPPPPPAHQLFQDLHDFWEAGSGPIKKHVSPPPPPMVWFGSMPMINGNFATNNNYNGYWYWLWLVVEKTFLVRY